MIRMKKILLLLLLVPSFLLAQEIDYNPVVPIDTANKKICYQEVVLLPGLTKKQIFTAAANWLANEISIVNGYITYCDPEAGRIIVRSTVFGKRQVGLAIGHAPFPIMFEITFLAKDGKYKYVITNFPTTYGLTDELIPETINTNIYITEPKYKDKKGNYTGMAKTVLKVIDGYAQYIIISLKDGIAKQKYPADLIDNF